MNRFAFLKPILIRLSLLWLVYAYARMLFLLFNPSYQSSFVDVLNAFWVGSWYDTSAIVYTNALLFCAEIIQWFLPKPYLQKPIRFFFWIFNIPFFLLNFIDIEYIHFTGKRSGIDILSEASDWAPLLKQYVFDYWYLILLFLPNIWALNVINRLALPSLASNLKTRGFRLLFLIPVLGLLFLGARGGWGLTPLMTPDASKYVGGKNIALAVNTPFNFIMTIQQQGLQELTFLPESLAQERYSPIHPIHAKQNAQKPNIVLVIVESLGKEYTGSRFGKKTLSPFLDSLTQCSDEYIHAYSNGKRSIEGIPAILSGMPTWMNSDYLSSFYQSNRLNSMGDWFQKQQYNSSFYHGGRNGTMSFDMYIALSNGGHYFGMNEYPNKADFDGSWGIFDDAYLSYVASELDQKPNPFFSAIFTLSSHHPYTIPAALKNHYPAGTLAIHASIRYVDDALRQFFNRVKQSPWYSNTLFVITADHASENEEAYFQSPQGKFEIPLIVFHPAHPIHRVIQKTVSQCDIGTLLAEECGSDQAYFGFGSYPQDSFAIQYQDGYYQMVQYPYVYQMKESGGIGFYKLDTDSLMQHNRLRENDAQKEKMDLTLKAVIQQYNHRLIHNQTYLP